MMPSASRFLAKSWFVTAPLLAWIISWPLTVCGQSELANKMKSGDISSRLQAISSAAGAASPDSDVLAALRDLYLNDGDLQIRRAARSALGTLHRAAPRSTSLAAAPYVFSSVRSVEAAPAVDLSAKPDATFRHQLMQPFDHPVNRTYVEPTPPTPRVEALIKQLASNPVSSIAASRQLAELGKEAEPASQALIEVMMRRQSDWRDARIAATEALEKIVPRLQLAVWTMIVEDSLDMSLLERPLRELDAMGPHAYAALPLVFSLWNKPVETGLREDPQLLFTMHAIAPRDSRVTNEVVRILKKELPVGHDTEQYAIEIANQRGLPSAQVLELISVHALAGNLFASQKLLEMVKAKELPEDPVVKLFIRCLEKEASSFYVQQLGYFGPAAKEALPALKRIKFEHPSRELRGIAEDAIKLIDM